MSLLSDRARNISITILLALFNFSTLQFNCVCMLTVDVVEMHFIFIILFFFIYYYYYCYCIKCVISVSPIYSNCGSNGGSILVHVGTNNAEREGTTAIVRKYRQLVRRAK